MSIFVKFNNQGLGDEDAFEELCCQLFETWGIRTMGFNSTWTYRDIRGDGGDGGIEAYWHDTNSDEFIGIQAKWFRGSITTSQYGQIRKSILMPRQRNIFDSKRSAIPENNRFANGSASGIGHSAHNSLGWFKAGSTTWDMIST